MKRSKSTHNQTKRASPHHTTFKNSKSTKKGFKMTCDHKQEINPEEIKLTDGCWSNKNIQKRLNNIRKGFQVLEDNLSFNYLASGHKKQPSMSGNTPRLTQRKNPRKIFLNQAPKTIKKKKCHTSNVINKQKKATKPCLKQNYHSCIYEESLMSLMKIVAMQKQQIDRLKKLEGPSHQIKQ